MKKYLTRKVVVERAGCEREEFGLSIVTVDGSEVDIRPFVREEAGVIALDSPVEIFYGSDNGLIRVCGIVG